MPKARLNHPDPLLHDRAGKSAYAWQSASPAQAQEAERQLEDLLRPPLAQPLADALCVPHLELHATCCALWPNWASGRGTNVGGTGQGGEVVTCRPSD